MRKLSTSFDVRNIALKCNNKKKYYVFKFSRIFYQIYYLIYDNPTV